MEILTFTTTGGWNYPDGFGCASLGLAGICDNSQCAAVSYPNPLKAVKLTGTYEEILNAVSGINTQIHAAIVLFGNAGGENAFLQHLREHICCPMVGGGAAIDNATGRTALITGNGEAAVLLITDDRYTYKTYTQCIHDEILEECVLTTEDPRTILTINGLDAATYLAQKRKQLGLSDSDFEHLTLSDMSGINAHLSNQGGKIKSGRDVHTKMLLRYVSHEKIYDTMRNFYMDRDAIVFGCAGLSRLLDRPLDTDSLGLFLFGEVCTVDDHVEFGNLMLSKLQIREKETSQS